MTNLFALRNDLEDEFAKESDRGCAILTLCLLEESLVKLLSKILPRGESDARVLVPKGRLSAGVANARAIGLLDDTALTNFRGLIEIRNIFAHKLLSGVTFASDQVRAKVESLQLPNMEAAPAALAEIRSDPRRYYLTVADSLFFTLEWLTDRAKPLALPSIPLWKIRQLSKDSDGKWIV